VPPPSVSSASYASTQEPANGSSSPNRTRSVSSIANAPTPDRSREAQRDRSPGLDARVRQVTVATPDEDLVIVVERAQRREQILRLLILAPVGVLQAAALELAWLRLYVGLVSDERPTQIESVLDQFAHPGWARQLSASAEPRASRWPLP
jgi:hypothetical protein